MKERERVRWLLKQENTRTFWQEITCSGVRVTIDSIVHYSHSHKATCINQFTFNCFVSGVLSGRVVRKSFATNFELIQKFSLTKKGVSAIAQSKDRKNYTRIEHNALPQFPQWVWSKKNCKRWKIVITIIWVQRNDWPHCTCQCIRRKIKTIVTICIAALWECSATTKPTAGNCRCHFFRIKNVNFSFFNSYHAM